MTTIRVKASGKWGSLRLGQLWEYRDLLYFLGWRDIKVRYKQTMFGAAWAILQPLLLMVVFTVFLGRLAHVPSEGVPYPLFAYCGLVLWTLFAQTVGGASNSLVDNVSLVSKVYFPRLVLPMAAAGPFLLDFAIAFVLLAGMIVVYSADVSATALFAPLFVALALAAALGFGVWLAALNVRYRDVRYAVPFLLTVWLFLSPVAYPASEVPKAWQTLYALNPMAGAIEGFRWCLLGSGAPAPWSMIGVSAAAAAVLLASGLLYFQGLERRFADVI